MFDHSRHTYDWVKILVKFVSAWVSKAKLESFMNIRYIWGYITYDVKNFGYHLIIILIYGSIHKFWMQIYGLFVAEDFMGRLLTALHVMQMRYSDENSVRLSVTGVYCDKTEDLSRFLYHTKDNLA